MASEPDRDGTRLRRRFLKGAALPALAVLHGRAGAASTAADRVGRAAFSLDVREFGAAGDGASDDTAAVQRAIDAATAAGGGGVAFPPGTYRTRTLTIDSGVHLAGSGIGATTLKLLDGARGDLLVSRRFAELSGTNAPAGAYDWSVRSMTIDGNRGKSAGRHGLCVYGYGYLLGDLRVHDCGGAGIYSEWSTEGLAPRGHSMEAQVVNLKVHDCGQGGVLFRGPHDSQFVNCVVYHGTTTGVSVEQGPKYSATGCQFVNCHVWGHHAHGWVIEAGYVCLVNCSAEWASSAQVLVASNDTTILGGIFFGDPKGAQVGIEIGTAGKVVYGTQIDSRMSDLNGGALKFTNEGGSGKVKALIYQTKGEPYRGTPSPKTSLELAVNGVGSGSVTVLPTGPLAWNGGAAITRHLSGTSEWSPGPVPHGSAAVATVGVPGASVGDTVAVGFSRAVPGGALLAGAVTADGRVTVTLLNQTGRALSLGRGTLRADCWVH